MLKRIKEPLCDSCNHGEVCSHKNNYLDMIDSLQKAFNEFPEKDRNFMVLNNPDCKFYSKNLTSLHKIQITNEVNDNKISAQTFVEESRKAIKASAHNLC